MDAGFWLFIDASLGDDARREGLHLAFLAISAGCSLVMGVIGFLLRRDLQRSDEDREAMAAAIKALEEKVDSNKDRHGYEISDIRIAVAPLFTKAELDQPNYPSR